MRVLRHGRTRADDGTAADAGASSVEYSLAALGVAGVLAAAVFGLGDRLANVFDCVSFQVGSGSASCAGGTGQSTDPEGPGPTGEAPTTSSSEPTTAPTTTTTTTSGTTTGGTTTGGTTTTSPTSVTTTTTTTTDTTSPTPTPTDSTTPAG